MADGIEDEAPEDKELLSAMEELERAKQRVDQLARPAPRQGDHRCPREDQDLWLDRS